METPRSRVGECEWVCVCVCVCGGEGNSYLSIIVLNYTFHSLHTPHTPTLHFPLLTYHSPHSPLLTYHSSPALPTPHASPHSTPHIPPYSTPHIPPHSPLLTHLSHICSSSTTHTLPDPTSTWSLPSGPLLKRPKLAPWPPRNSPIFGPLNAIMERCYDLLELVQTVLDFR